MSSNSWRGASVVFLAFAATIAFAAKEKPLDRRTPVPADQPIPVMDFFRPRLFDNPELNPAGTHFAAIVTDRDDSHALVVCNLATKKFEGLGGGGDLEIDRYEWLNDKRLLFSVTKDKLYSYGLFAAEVGRLSRSYPLQRYNSVIPVAYPKKTPLEVVIWIKHSAADDGADGGVFRLSTNRSMDGKDGALLMDDDGLRADVVHTYRTPSSGVPAGYFADKDGELAFALTVKDGRATLHRLVKDRWEPCPVDLDEIDIITVGDAPGELLVLGPRQEGKPRALRRMDAVTGELGEILYQDEEYDFVAARIYRHPVDGKVLGVQYSRKGPQSVWFDPAYRGVQAALERALPNQIVRILGSDREEKFFFISASSDVSPPTYYHVKLAAKSFSLISNVAPWIDAARMRPMMTLNYKARDGIKIEGYMTLPANASKDNPAPLVVLPHGGPWVRDNWGWDPEVQFLASRGYAVFQPNYRGSPGYAWKFPERDMWDFLKMHNDVTDGVKAVIKTGLIDPNRIAIMGGSFGGYLALCGVAHEPELYRCAITMAGVFDWERMMKDARHSDYLRTRDGIFRRNLGDPKKRQEAFDAISPIRHVSNIKVPVFVAHGKEDIVASVAQSKLLLAELKKHGVPFEKRLEGGEGHGFEHLENQVELYSAIEAFLGKHLAPKPVELAVTSSAAP